MRGKEAPSDVRRLEGKWASNDLWRRVLKKSPAKPLIFLGRGCDKALCNTPQGAYTCQGPQSGGVVCPKCVSTPNSILSSNNSSTFNTPGHSSSNPTNEYDQQG
ncbi:hypothetical protein PGT21_005222 [Puccinia graminis f. sp. tritici]|uniref:Uncharacterized protein n=1 Tax=Puccinia graminis f. sp. tritici TaxID=56615 RepID=A0A5B0LWN3_PUCGR|nr:hypothetical protein PGT21_005222 [Puccinia graminis f. sp. tritici]